MNVHPLLRTLITTAGLLAAPLAWSGADVAGQKLDSGLGELPHYSKWADPSGRAPVKPASTAVLGESLDSGLGELPHYSKWKDPTGRDPMGLAVRVASTGR